MQNNTTTYKPDNSISKGYISIFAEITHELKNSKFLMWQLFKRNFFAMYKQSFLGIFWPFIIPVFSIGTFILLNRSGVFNIGKIDVPYPIFAILGMAFWQLFSVGLSGTGSSLSMAGQMLAKINFSKKSLVISSLGRAVVSFLIQMSLVAVLFVVYKIVPDIKTLLVPLIIIPILLMTLGFGFILSLINGVVRDISNMLSMALTFFMFLTPVLYAKPRIGILAGLTKFNPMYYFITTARDLILKGEVSEPVGLIWSSVFAVAVFIICLVLFHLTETRVTERI